MFRQAEKPKYLLYLNLKKSRNIFENSRLSLQHLVMPAKFQFSLIRQSIAEDAVSVLIHQAALYMPFADLVDIDKEIERLTKKKIR